MTSHGWGGVVLSSNPGEIAKEISAVEGVIKAVVVKGWPYKILFGFDLRLRGASEKGPERIRRGFLGDLIADIYRISVDILRVDTWIGLDEYYYEKGKPMKI